jgi:hypothetical protein
MQISPINLQKTYSEAKKVDPPEAGAGVGFLRGLGCRCVRAFGQMSSACYDEEFGVML